MSRLLLADAVLTGRVSSYTIIKELHRAVDEGAVCLARQVSLAYLSLPQGSRWLGVPFSLTATGLCRNLAGERCVVKSIRGHWRLQNEADVLRRYQSQTPFLRPLVDEICEPADPPSIVLRHLDSDALTESNRKRLSRPEIKQVARSVLEALHVLHKDGMVQTGRVKAH